MAKTSRVFDFVALANDGVYDVSANSFADQIRAVQEAIGFAIKHQFWWDKADYARLVARYERAYRCQNGVVFGVDHVDNWHACAVRAENASAATSIDAYAGQKAVWGMAVESFGVSRKTRLTVGSAFIMPNGEQWRLSQLPHRADPEDKRHIRAVHADGRRRRIAVGDLLPPRTKPDA